MRTKMLNEQSLSTSSARYSELAEANTTVQLHDQSGSLGLQEAQADTRRSIDKLSTPMPSVYIPEPSSRAHSAHQSVSRPFSAVVQNPNCELLSTRNVVVFGESGVGKSSVINMIAGENITQTSSNAVGCTFRYQCHQVFLDGLGVNLWDTVGLDEGTEGTIPAKQAEQSLKAFLRQITQRKGVDLLLYCIRGTRVRQALLRNYNLFYTAICRKKVPVALVVTGLENYQGDMEGWWTEHEKDLIKHGMRFDAHACVTTMRSDHPAIQGRLKLSRDALRNLVRTKPDTVPWRADGETLISASLPDVRALLRAAEKRATPLIAVCDATEDPNRVGISPVTEGCRDSCMNNRKYQCLYVDAWQLLLEHPKLAAETIRRPDLLIFFADADSEADRLWAALERFYMSFGGETCPMVIGFRGLNNHEDAVKMWRSLSFSRDGQIIASPTYYPGAGTGEVVEKAGKALAALIEEKCLAKFEERLTKFQRFCRRGKHFFTERY